MTRKSMNEYKCIVGDKIKSALPVDDRQGCACHCTLHQTWAEARHSNGFLPSPN